MSEKRMPKISIGITSLTVILCVLCLTVFAVLTLTTAISERELAEKRAEVTSDYYAAENEAAKLVNELQIAWEIGADLQEIAEKNGIVIENDIFRFQKAIDEGQELNVVLRLENGFEIEAWQIVSVVDWTPDESIQVWDGLF
ncbi:MAG: hypothetical protein IKT73_11175 [Anaerotignum sp.]|nr:hypothetical protein [Anaerotignum sp.]